MDIGRAELSLTTGSSGNCRKSLAPCGLRFGKISNMKARRLRYARKINGIESSSEHFDHGTANGTVNGIVDDTAKSNSASLGTADRIVEEIRAKWQITYDGLAEVVGVSRRTISREIKVLLSKGVIRRVGSDKTGHWEVVK